MAFSSLSPPLETLVAVGVMKFDGDVAAARAVGLFHVEASLRVRGVRIAVLRHPVFVGLIAFHHADALHGCALFVHHGALHAVVGLGAAVFLSPATCAATCADAQEGCQREEQPVFHFQVLDFHIGFVFWGLFRNDFQSDDGGGEGSDEEEAPEGGGLVEDEDADDDRPQGANACPHGVGGSDGQRLSGFGQQYGTEHVEEGKSPHPLPVGHPLETFGLAEAEGEPHLAKAC